MTDDTARAILAEFKQNPQSKWVTSVCAEMPIIDLQAMARLWMMLPEIREYYEMVVETGDPYDTKDEVKLLEKLEDLGK